MPYPPNPPPSTSDIVFRGGASILKPNHITRYSYPCTLHLFLSRLRLQTPVNASQRSRPQGRSDFGIDGSTFLTISRAYRTAPHRSALAIEREADSTSTNPLGRAMSRVTKSAGNTLLQSGKFQLRDGMTYVIKRTTTIPLADGAFAREEDVYEIPCQAWRSMRPPSAPGHDSWWMRLHDLYAGGTDRTVWSAWETMDGGGVPAGLVGWFPRPDVENAVTVYRSTRHISSSAHESAYLLCSRTWFEDSEYACQLKCGHWCCLECITKVIDEAGKPRTDPSIGELDPPDKFWRCPLCNAISPVLTDRADIIRPDELPYWRYKIARHRLVLEVSDWIFRLAACELDRWCAPLPPHLERDDADVEDVKRARTVVVHMPDAARMTDAIPIFVAGVLDWGFSLDNPVNSAEGDVLKQCLLEELGRLARSGKRFNTKDLEEHMMKVGEAAVRPVVVEKKGERLGNPVFPPGFVAYREWLCTWTARACFYSPTGRGEILKFMQKMGARKDERDVWFGRGAPVWSC
ncbi:hypothetical protein CC86DRAFT_177091 [Ophiobolus disseminans]|uniref:RING-type domain-containing protein n=1 Tax=Ophiobolus disseminans TaxID=1469910 RepID=A0A6A7A9C2_9PLEO|nr:hypothetical protein CC86DRAFT_177091 [Ophiobolus disseminans]